ncbi:hypothetical protein BCCR75501_01668 [Burkholderia sola]|nr:hypothetical protein BCCR75389_01666 [Burkholderia cenocepacia]CAG2272717.1 hypothetical protein BCCR75388_01684 [Burkholderia cenocepacia]CAG2272962.1 hypothetical protein BCCR75384_01682 [Burkholderia cenocepacia]CAG2294166.1 hypothetical protein BCCR75390_01669 [Burkholderia cenocepacia]CAG2294336.1 hypothetical protein BCCR75587_01670 [Burkholderia cenocepacia]
MQGSVGRRLFDTVAVAGVVHSAARHGEQRVSVGRRTAYGSMPVASPRDTTS